MKKPSLGTVFSVVSVLSMGASIVLSIIGPRVQAKNLEDAVEAAVTRRLGKGEE